MNTCYTLITAHSGCNNTTPNTLDSLIVGMKSGADFIEVDVRAEKNGVPVLFHDDSIITKNHGEMRICEYSLTDLNNFIGSDPVLTEQYSEIISFSEAVSTAKEYGCFLNVDIKDDPSIDPLVRIIQDADMVDSVVITGCHYERAQIFKEKYPELQVLLNINRNMFLDTENSASALADKICSMAIEAACCGINIEYKYLTNELINKARRRFLPISIWTLEEYDDLEYYLRMGVYSITTMAVDILVGKRKKYSSEMALPGMLPEKI